MLKVALASVDDTGGDDHNKENNYLHGPVYLYNHHRYYETWNLSCHHDADFVVTGGTVGYHQGNLRSYQWSMVMAKLVSWHLPGFIEC